MVTLSSRIGSVGKSGARSLAFRRVAEAEPSAMAWAEQNCRRSIAEVEPGREAFAGTSIVLGAPAVLDGVSCSRRA